MSRLPAKRAAPFNASLQQLTTKSNFITSSAILVNKEQKGNAVLNFISKTPWTFGTSPDFSPDYEVGKTTCIHFLSIRYHRMHPNYIYDRYRQLGHHKYRLRILLVLVDVPSGPEKTLLELTRVSLSLDFTIVLAWSNEEAARYLETFKLYENRSAESIRERPSTNPVDRAIGLLSGAIPKVNKTDAAELIAAFGCVRECLNVRREDLELMAGFGEAKIDAYLKAIHEPFFSSKNNGSDDEQLEITDGKIADVDGVDNVESISSEKNSQ